MTVYSSHLYKNMHLGFSCLFFLLNLICDISSLSVSIILSTNLLTELGIDRLGIYYKTSQCLINSFVGVSTWCNTCKCCCLGRRKCCSQEVSYVFIFCVLIILIICSDTELNPGPKKDKSCDNFSLCHWNLNSIAAHDFSKLSLLETYNTYHM